MNTTWKVDFEHADQRLDVFLSEMLPGLSRSAIAKLLKQGAGLVNDKPASVHRFLKQGDKVRFELNIATDTKVSAKTVKSNSRFQIPNSRFSFQEMIVQETPDWIVIDKPAGLMVHPDAKQKTGTLVDLIVSHDPAIAKVGEDPERPGIVHRLDRDVSGLMVIAKNQKTFDSLKSQFAKHQTSKAYLALIYGLPAQDEGDIKFRIARSTSKPRMAARPANENEGKAAWTHYKVLKKFKNASLVRAEIISGRTHQIRAHFHALGHPVIGDRLYTHKKIKQIPAGRIMLQSVSLDFIDPKTNEPLHFDLKTDQSFDILIQNKLK
ncbi:MAG: RluA family pseudouridine synthase [Patescibacteria group bacterium]